MPHHDRYLSSRELLNRIGLSEDSPSLLLDEDLDTFDSDLAPVLLERYRQLQVRHQFAPGDLVTWKPGLCNRRAPKPGQPAVVIEVLEQPVFDTEIISGSTYFREPLDIILGVIWDEEHGRGDFVTFHFNSQYFEFYRG